MYGRNGCMVEMEPTRAKFKIWGQRGIPELAGVNLGRESNSGLNNNMMTKLEWEIPRA